LNNYKQTYSPDDATLIKRCLQGNSNAWQTLVDRYGGLVHSVPVRHGLQPDEVDDVGQDTFLALAQNLHTIDKPESLGAWLVTTARRLSWRAIQKRRREAPVPEADLSDAFPKHIVDSVSGKMPSITELMDGWSNQEAKRSANSWASPKAASARPATAVSKIYVRLWKDWGGKGSKVAKSQGCKVKRKARMLSYFAPLQPCHS